MQWQLITPKSWQPVTERRPAWVTELAMRSRIDALIGPEPEVRTASEDGCHFCTSGLYDVPADGCPACEPEPRDRIDVALEEQRRATSDRWLEEQRVIRESGIEHSAPIGRVIEVR